MKTINDKLKQLAALPLEKIMENTFSKHFSELYIVYYVTLAQARLFGAWKEYALKDLDDTIAPSRMEIVYGELRFINPLSPESYVIKKENIEEKYNRLLKRIHKKHTAFYIALQEVLTEPEQEYFMKFYENEDAEDELFMRLNQRLQRFIDDMTTFPELWEDELTA